MLDFTFFGYSTPWGSAPICPSGTLYAPLTAPHPQWPSCCSGTAVCGGSLSRPWSEPPSPLACVCHWEQKFILYKCPATPEGRLAQEGKCGHPWWVVYLAAPPNYGVPSSASVCGCETACQVLTPMFDLAISLLR